jgi:Gluconate 2-dehydrogenase subunit 3
MNLTRRDLAWIVTRAAAAAGGQQFFSRWLRAAQDESAQPKFFDSIGFRIVTAFTEILIPTDDTPGAREARVAEFIDFVVFSAAEYAPEMQTSWRKAISWLGSRNFDSLSHAEQLALVEKISQPAHEAHGIFVLIKEMTVHAFYTSRVGLVDVLHYKGNAYLTEFPACTHPEHRKVG